MASSKRNMFQRFTTAGTVVVYIASVLMLSAIAPPKRVGAVGECSNPTDEPVPTGIVQNGNFTIAPADVNPPGNQGYDNVTTYNYANAGFYSQVQFVGPNNYPRDIIPYRNQFSIMSGSFDDAAELSQLPFPGDFANGVPPTNTWFYSNGNALIGGEYLNWEQDVSGLSAGTEYVFVAYISSVVERANPPHDPTMSLKIGGTTGLPDGTTILDDVVLTEAATSNSQPLNGWQRVAFRFTATGPTEKLKITDSSPGINGDDFAMTAVSLQMCVPIKDGWTPIMRTYGNDVFAGGGYFDGSTCVSQGAPVANPAVKGFGRYNPTSPMDHTTYSGTASELGIFTPGEIMGFLPGANMLSARSALWELSFANTVDNAVVKKIPASYNFGGGFGTSYCPTFPVPVSPQLRNGAALPINSLASGDYVINRPSVRITAPGAAQITNGTRVRIFADGDVHIEDNIQYANVGAGWATAGDIPLVEIYANGNIFVENSVSELTGVFKAKGGLYTCVAPDGTILRPNKLPTEYNTPGVGHHMTYMANNCQNKLTVYGSVTAEEMFLYRTTREGLENASVGEDRSSGNLAEAFVFSPEVYLAYLSAHPSSGTSVGSPDSIVALPPVY